MGQVNLYSTSLNLEGSRVNLLYCDVSMVSPIIDTYTRMEL